LSVLTYTYLYYILLFSSQPSTRTIWPRTNYRRDVSSGVVLLVSGLSWCVRCLCYYILYYYYTLHIIYYTYLYIYYYTYTILFSSSYSLLPLYIPFPIFILYLSVLTYTYLYSILPNKLSISKLKESIYL
jgi:hypothetical protein